MLLSATADGSLNDSRVNITKLSNSCVHSNMHLCILSRDGPALATTFSDTQIANTPGSRCSRYFYKAVQLIETPLRRMHCKPLSFAHPNRHTEGVWAGQKTWQARDHTSGMGPYVRAEQGLTCPSLAPARMGIKTAAAWGPYETPHSCLAPAAQSTSPGLQALQSTL